LPPTKLYAELGNIPETQSQNPIAEEQTSKPRFATFSSCLFILGAMNLILDAKLHLEESYFERFMFHVLLLLC
jgi:hypothetical protein